VIKKTGRRKILIDFQNSFTGRQQHKICYKMIIT